MKNETFTQLLIQRKNQKIKKKPKVQQAWLFPNSAEKKYDSVLYKLVREIKEQINLLLVPEIPSMIQEVESKMPNDRNDQFLGKLHALIKVIEISLRPSVENAIAESVVIAFDINKFNEKQFQKMNQHNFGIDIFLHEPWLEDQLKLFADQNAQLIKSLPLQELSRVGGEIERGLQQGVRFTDIANTIKKSFGITHRRATLIARDQTTKLNASLTRLRQQEVGVEEYIWQTSGDERVRPTHRANDGKKFRWDTPPKTTGHPGNDVNCRCVARPVLDKLLNLS